MELLLRLVAVAAGLGLVTMNNPILTAFGILIFLSGMFFPAIKLLVRRERND